MTTYTFNIKDALTFFAFNIYYLQQDYNYIPPVGGFINNDETEYDAIIWNDASEKPAWVFLHDTIAQEQIYVKGKYAGDNIVTDEAAILALQSSKFDKPVGTTSQYVRGDGTLATLPSTPAKSFSTPSRTIGTAFQISTTRDSSVVYSIPVTSNATLLAGSQVSATLQYADNSGMSTNVVTLPGDNFGIALGLLASGIGSLKLVGTIPAGKYVKITTTNIAGTPTLGTMVSQEVLL